MKRVKVVVAGAGVALALLLSPTAAGASASGGGSVGYCASYHVSLTTRTTAGAVAHAWTNYSVSWYNSTTTSRSSGRSVPFDYYGYSTAGSLVSLSTSC
jgi:hypothetical protein